MHDLKEKLDGEINAAGLLEELKDADDELARTLAKQSDFENSRLAQRRALLRQRRKNKNAHEQADQQIADKMELIVEEEEAKKEISEEYIRKMFKRDDDAEAETPE